MPSDKTQTMKREKSETISVRLTKQVRDLSEREAHAQRRTLSNFIECCVADKVYEIFGEKL